MAKSEIAHRICTTHDMVRYLVGGILIWEIAIESIQALGEFTDANGPIADDYFIVFVIPGGWLEASFYSEGREDLMTGLAARLGADLSFQLFRSTELASRVIWPPILCGDRLFDFRRKRPKGFLHGLKQRIIPEHDMFFTEAVAKYLISLEGDHPTGTEIAASPSA